MAKPVFLIGYMASGKSTSGKKLARMMGYAFEDTDAIIEQMTGKSIEEIFETDGEDAFRSLEHSVIRSLTTRINTVIATGGGAPCFYNNLELMQQYGITVYLKHHPNSIVTRLLLSKTKRPLLKTVSKDELLARITDHLTQREAYYLKARIIIKGENLDLEELSRIIKTYRG